MCKLNREFQNVFAFHLWKSAANSLLIGHGKRSFDKKKKNIANIFNDIIISLLLKDIFYFIIFRSIYLKEKLQVIMLIKNI